MKLSFILVFGLTAVLGQYTGDKGNGVEKGTPQLQELLNRIQVTPKVNFTRDDYEKLGRKLTDSAAIADLMIKQAVDVDLSDLSVDAKDAEDAIVLAAIEARNLLERRLINTFSGKAEMSEIDSTKAEMKLILDALFKVGTLDDKAAGRLVKYLDDHPYYLAGIKVAYVLEPELFEKDVLNYTTLFFEQANERDPELTHKLAKILNIVQDKYEVFPDDYYTKMKKTYVPKRNYRQRR
ncbi:hypothetical protein DSO57_1011099 [Entomophthora muscae]|uniref:Uncharacterized protein n=1 Tax=Entomophthora muscae TaxID=34485 RepID=A0ACC2T686_9FUNG|nr:hypothetical protein DSO57_1011099 [Entomophthora muscae]